MPLAELLLPAMVGAAVALLIDVVIKQVEANALGYLQRIPVEFRDAATDQVFGCGYYREDVKINIVLSDKESEKNEKNLTFSFTAKLVTVKDRVNMGSPVVEPSICESRKGDVTTQYHHNAKRVGLGKEVPLNGKANSRGVRNYLPH